MSNITKIKAQIGLFSHKASALDLQKAIFSLCVCVCLCLCLCMCVCVFFFSPLCFYMDISLCVERWMGVGESLVTLPFIRSYKVLSPIELVLHIYDLI